MKRGRGWWRAGICGAVLVTAGGLNPAAAGETWNELKEKHFIVYYADQADRATAQKILREAERYYGRIGDRIGFTRYNDFWTWDRRTKIFLFHDKASFTARTGQPEWSTGYVNRDSFVSRKRAIVTYVQEREFFDGLLPHEISHLTLHDYIQADDCIPMWLDEGVAQYFETGKPEAARRMMRTLAAQGAFIPFKYFMTLDISRESDPDRARVYYTQSLSVVDFLMARFGREAFARLCRGLRDGKPFDEALRSATQDAVPGLAELERQWLAYALGH